MDGNDTKIPLCLGTSEIPNDSGSTTILAITDSLAPLLPAATGTSNERVSSAREVTTGGKRIRTIFVLLVFPRSEGPAEPIEAAGERDPHDHTTSTSIFGTYLKNLRIFPSAVS